MRITKFTHKNSLHITHIQQAFDPRSYSDEKEFSSSLSLLLPVNLPSWYLCAIHLCIRTTHNRPHNDSYIPFNIAIALYSNIRSWGQPKNSSYRFIHKSLWSPYKFGWLRKTTMEGTEWICISAHLCVCMFECVICKMIKIYWNGYRHWH